jgi:hypothetical protein
VLCLSIKVERIGFIVVTQLDSEDGEHCHLGVGFNLLAEVGENPQ